MPCKIKIHILQRVYGIDNGINLIPNNQTRIRAGQGDLGSKGKQIEISSIRVDVGSSYAAWPDDQASRCPGGGDIGIYVYISVRTQGQRGVVGPIHGVVDENIPICAAVPMLM